MLTHIQLAAWVLNAVLVAMALSGSGCSHVVSTPAASPLASVKWDGPEVLTAGDICACGPTCKCSTTPGNKDCQCPKCPKCERCVCQCECPKGEKPSEVNAETKAAAIEPGFVPVPDPIGEGTEGPGGFTGLLCIMDNGPCPHCVTQTATVASMPAWKDRIRIVHDGEQQAYGIGEVYGFPAWVAFIEGRAVRMHTGALSGNEIADFNGNQPFGTTAMRRAPVRVRYSYCESCR